LISWRPIREIKSRCAPLSFFYDKGLTLKQVAKRLGVRKAEHVADYAHRGLVKLWSAIGARGEAATDLELVKKYEYLLPRMVTPKQEQIIRLWYFENKRLVEIQRELGLASDSKVEFERVNALYRLRDLDAMMSNAPADFFHAADQKRFVERYAGKIPELLVAGMNDQMGDAVALVASGDKDIVEAARIPEEELRFYYLRTVQMLWNKVAPWREAAFVKQHRFLLPLLSEQEQVLLRKLYVEGRSQQDISTQLNLHRGFPYDVVRNAVAKLLALVSPLSDLELFLLFRPLVTRLIESEVLTERESAVLESRLVEEKSFTDIAEAVGRRRKSDFARRPYLNGIYKLRVYAADPDSLRTLRGTAESQRERVVAGLPESKARRLVSAEAQIELYRKMDASGHTPDNLVISDVAMDPVVHRIVLNRVLGMVPEKGKLLSVGEGRGHLAHSLIERGVDVRSVDISPENTAFARERGVRQKVANAHALPFNSARFDVVLFNESIGGMWLEDALREARRVLKPGGQIIITTYPESERGRAKGAEYLYYSLQEIEDELNKLGFVGFHDKPILRGAYRSRPSKGLMKKDILLHFLTASLNNSSAIKPIVVSDMPTIRLIVSSEIFNRNLFKRSSTASASWIRIIFSLPGSL